MYEDFSGHEAGYIDSYELPVHDTGVLIGTMDGVLYTTTRDGKKESYIHKFKKKSRPYLAVSFDGKQLYILCGAYTFTESGIVDK